MHIMHFYLHLLFYICVCCGVYVCSMGLVPEIKDFDLIETDSVRCRLKRLPKDADALREFSAKIYSAPVAPLTRLDERSLRGVTITSMHLTRTG